MFGLSSSVFFLIIIGIILFVAITFCFAVFAIYRIIVLYRKKKTAIGFVSFAPSVSRCIGFMVEMKKEQTRNHELDPKKAYNEKIQIGSAQFSSYKSENGIRICDYYEAG